MRASRGVCRPRVAGRRSVGRVHERLEARLLLDGAAGASAEYGQLPLSFEINQGQTAPQVNFLAHGSGYGLFLTPSEAVLSLQSHAGSAGSSPHKSSGDTLEMQFIGTNPDAQATGIDKLAGVTNYLIGNDPSKWHTGVANYGQVKYQNLYAGVNLTYYGNQRQLEYDFTVAAGADPSQIVFHVAGAQSVSLDAQGNLVLQTSGGDVIEHAPVIYQQTSAGRQMIDGHYTLSGDGRIGFAIGNYDHGQTLVIDPILSYSTYLGGSNFDDANAIAVDSAGEAYVAGDTGSFDFPVTPGALQTSNAGGFDAFVAKLNAAGSGLVYSTYLGGSSGSDSANAIALDAAGEAYVAGSTSSTDFPTTLGAIQSSNAGGGDAFVAKLNAAGSALVYSTYLGGNGNDQASAIAIDAAGNAYVAGDTTFGKFPTTPGAFQISFNGVDDAFVAKLNAAGSALIYSTYLHGTSHDFANGIAVDAAGDAYVAGATSSLDFPTTSGALQISNAGFGNAFVTKLNAAGSALVYSTYLGGSNFDQANGIAVDAAGEAYVAGLTESANFPTTPGALQKSISGGESAFVAKLNAAGNGLVYSTYLGGNKFDQANAIAVNAAGEAYVVGQTTSANFPTTPGAPQSYYAGNEDVFVAKLNAAGSGLVYATYLGGNSNDQVRAIAIDAAGEAYVAGTTSSANFPITPGALQTKALSSNPTAFVFKLATTALNLAASQVSAAEGATFAGPVGLLIDEVQPFDPASNFTALVDWGDGNTSAATLAPYGNGFNLLASHTYAEDGVYLLTVTVVDADRGSATAAGTATVADAPLSGVSRAAAFTEGVALLRSVASFEDDDRNGDVGDYAANIDWGDGQTSTGTVVAGRSLFDVTGLHQYVSDGNYPITITVHDAGGAATVIHSTATVADSLAAKPVNLTVYGSKSFNGTVATFTDPDNSLGPTDYTAKITWDDGTTTSGVITAAGSGPNATFSVAGTHLFASFAGFHAVNVAITDVDDGSVTTVVDSVLDPPGLMANQIYVLNAFQGAFGTVGTTDTVVAGNTLAAWAAKLDAGATRASFSTALLGSGEYYGMLVGNLYQQYLGRAADAAGQAYWVAQMRQGETDAQIEAAFAGSGEFYQHAGGTDAGWVSAMYQAILGRAADASGLAYWTAELGRGASRAAVAQGFAASPERETQLISDDYFTDLGRATDPAGQTYWLHAFENGVRNEDIIAGFLASREYYKAHSS